MNISYLRAPAGAHDAFVLSLFDLSKRDAALFELADGAWVSRDRLFEMLANDRQPAPDFVQEHLALPPSATWADAARLQLRKERVRQMLVRAVDVQSSA